MLLDGPRMKLIRIAVLALICCPAASGSFAEERYFVTVYSAQLPTINLPRYAHTWGTFVKLSREDEHGEYSVEAFTISWLPATLDVRPARLRPEVGVNLTLRETIDYCASKNMEVRQLGPYPIDPELYRIERERYDSLQRGERLYVAGDLMNTPPARDGLQLHLRAGRPGGAATSFPPRHARLRLPCRDVREAPVRPLHPRRLRVLRLGERPPRGRTLPPDAIRILSRPGGISLQRESRLSETLPLFRRNRSPMSF
jgi:hypothetical protein